ncbi:MAG: Lrp/AsnC family transcriptional regulator [Acidobacteriota bacterium]
MNEIEHRDRELLNVLQSEIPISSTPYALIGQVIDMSEKEVIKRITRLKSEGVVRRITGVFDSRRLGYSTCLVAARVEEGDVDRAAATINLHPGVSQNYLRNHDFNLWFTITVAPDSKLGLEKTVAILGEEAECRAVRLLPKLRVLKSANGDSESAGGGEGDDDSTRIDSPLTPEEIEALRLLQRDLPLQPRPFDELASAANMSGEQLLDFARTFASRQQLRQFTGSLDLKKPSFSATTLGVWKVPEAELDDFGAKLIPIKAVSQSYLRPVYSDWPYNVFTTVHGRSVDECESVLAEIERSTGVTERNALYPTRELKKARVTLFSPEQRSWEEAHLTAESESAVS